MAVSSEDINGPANDAKQENSYLANGFRRKKKAKSGQVTTEYSAGLSTALAKAGADTISYLQGHQILGFEKNDEFFFYLTDALGAVRDIVRGTDGAVLQSYDYKENGEKTSSTSLKSDKTWVGGLSVNDDTADSGLYLMGHRHYDATLGRFLSRDPIGFAGGLNLYEYAGNSPVGMADPEGLQPGTLGEANWDPAINGVTGVTHTNRPQDVGSLVLGVFKTQGESISLVGSLSSGPLGSAAYTVDLINAAASGDPMGLLPFLVKGVPRRRFNSRADLFDWEHIFNNHAEWGPCANQRGGNNSIFVGKSERQIQSIVKEAWNRRKPTGRQQIAPNTGHLRVQFRGRDPISGWNIEMWYNRDLRLVETAYPLGIRR